MRALVPLLPWLAATALFGMRIGPRQPFAGIDGSWMTVLNGALGPLRHGDDVVFNYGPYTFLQVPQIVDRSQFVLGMVALTVVVLWTWTVCHLAFRQCTGRTASAAAATVTAIVAATQGAATAAVGAAAGTILLTLSRPRSPDWRPVLLVPPVLWGLAGALVVQVKLSDGVAFTALALVASLAARRPLLILLDAAVTLLAFGAGTVLWWLLAGQEVGDLRAWFAYGVDIVAGYGDAMSSEVPPYLLGYLAAGIVVVISLVTVLRRRAVQSRTELLGWILVFGVTLGYGVKSGFTRHDVHELTFFVVALILLAVAAGLTGLSRTAVTGAVVCLLMVFPGFESIDPGPARDRWRADVEVALRHDHAAGLLEATRLEMQTTYAVPQAMLDAIGSAPVTIDPHEATVAWAYSLTYRPVPVFQNYAVVTERLDRLNARAIKSASDDRYILRIDTPGFDGRNAIWESAHYKQAVACNFARLQREGIWSLLGKVDSRCGRVTVEGTQRVSAGEALEIPPAADGTIVTASFRPDDGSLLARLGHLLMKDYTPLRATVDGQDFKVLAHPATGPLMLSFPEVAEGAFDPFTYSEVSFSEPGTVTFATVEIR